MNKIEYFIVGCFLTGGLCFVTGFLVPAVFYGGDGYAEPWLPGAMVILMIVGTPFLIISFLTFLLVPNTIAGTKIGS